MYGGDPYVPPVAGPATIIPVTSSPDGVLSGVRGQLAVDTTTGTVWQNLDGATDWAPFGVRPIPWVTGRYYPAPQSSIALATSNSLGNGTLRAAPFYIPNPVTLTRIGSEIQGTGEAGSKLRLGIYADDGNGRPGALVVDAGQIAGDSATVQELTINTALNTGRYWSAAAVQSAPSSQPTVRVVNAIAEATDLGTTIPTAALSTFGFQQTGVTAALPATFSMTGLSGTMARVFVKV